MLLGRGLVGLGGRRGLTLRRTLLPLPLLALLLLIEAALGLLCLVGVGLLLRCEGSYLRLLLIKPGSSHPWNKCAHGRGDTRSIAELQGSREGFGGAYQEA